MRKTESERLAWTNHLFFLRKKKKQEQETEPIHYEELREILKKHKKWLLSEKKDGDTSVARGSGLRVGEDGVVCNHHFLLPKDGALFQFSPGEYVIETYATLVNNSTPLLLSRLKLPLVQEQATAIMSQNAGVYFDWGPDSMSYHPHIDTPPWIKIENYEGGKV